MFPEYFETACDFDDDIEIFPFAYRTHAHALGKSIILKVENNVSVVI